MQIKQTHNQSFGWSGKTHYQITSAVSKQFPVTAQYSKLLGCSSVLPDWSLSKCWADLKKPHLYYGEELLSYDTIPQNASDFYFVFLSKALQYLRNGNNKIGMYYAGNALHFLQDATCPLHTKKECLKLSKAFAHKKYEKMAKSEKIFTDNLILSPKNTPDVNFQDCFVDAYNKSSSMKNPFILNKEELTTSVRESLENAYTHTAQFLKRLSNLVNVPPHKQDDIFLKEVKESFHY